MKSKELWTKIDCCVNTTLMRDRLVANLDTGALVSNGIDLMRSMKWTQEPYEDRKKINRQNRPKKLDF